MKLKLFIYCFTFSLLLLFFLVSCNRNSDSSAGFILEPLNTGSDASIRALHIVDENTVWAGGSAGTYLLTTDGGESWKTGQLEGAETDEFRSIYAWDSQHALLFGVANPGRGYYTSTAGEDWEIIYENSSAGIFFNTMTFADNRRGIALSDATDSIPFLIRTVDGGANWSRITNLPILDKGEFHFAASNSCLEYLESGDIWIVTGGGNARVFHSPDNGDSWSVASTDITHRTVSSGIFSVAFIDGQRGVIVGGTYNQPSLNDSIAAYSVNGGASWQLAETMPAEYRSSVTWLSGKKDIALAVGKTGWDYSTDYGKNWIFLSDSGYYTARTIPGTHKGFAAGSGGRIARFELKTTKD